MPIQNASLEVRLWILGEDIAAHQNRTLLQQVELSSIRRRVVFKRIPSRKYVSWLALAAAALLSLAVGFGLHTLRKPQALSFAMGNATSPGAQVGATIAAGPVQPIDLMFSDGSTLKLAPQASGSVAELNPAGARIVLESGQATVRVNPRSGAHWKFNAGPFVVDVTGTEFNLAWDPPQQRLLLAMKTGSIKLSGCKLTEPRVLRAPEVVDISCRKTLAESDAKAGVPPNEDLASEDNAKSEFATNRPSAAKNSWQTLARRGKYKQAYTGVTLEGFNLALQNASRKDLALLGDISRYTGHTSEAGDAYRTLRRRFPATPEASAALFALARIAFDQRAAFGEAAELLRSYLSEQPRGQFAPEARGLLIEASTRAGSRLEARSAAADYLRRYPKGLYAAQAQKLLIAD